MLVVPALAYGLLWSSRRLGPVVVRQRGGQRSTSGPGALLAGLATSLVLVVVVRTVFQVVGLVGSGVVRWLPPAVPGTPSPLLSSFLTHAQSLVTHHHHHHHHHRPRPHCQRHCHHGISVQPHPPPPLALHCNPRRSCVTLLPPHPTSRTPIATHFPAPRPPPRATTLPQISFVLAVAAVVSDVVLCPARMAQGAAAAVGAAVGGLSYLHSIPDLF